MFCSKCGTMLPDGANFCASCGTPVATPNPVYTAPNVGPAPSNEQVYQSPVIEPVEIPARETVINNSFSAPVNETPIVDSPFSSPVNEASPVNSSFSTPVNETPSMDSPFSAFVNETSSKDSSFSAPVNEAPSMNSSFSAPVNETPVMNYNNQASFNGGYSQPQNNTYANNAFGNANGNAAPNPQPVYPNPMGMSPDNSQNWGPLMPPKKKSKAPVIIALSIIALLIVAAVVACCLIFCGKKNGSDSAEDALIAAFDAFADDNNDDALKVMHPLYNEMCAALDDLGSTYASLGLTSDALERQLIESSNPKSGGFKYSNLKIEDKETMDKDDVDEYNDTIRSTFKTYGVYFSAVGIDVGDVEDYMCEAAVTYTGTVDIDKTEYYFMAAMVKIDGSWYVATITSYEN